MQGLVKLADFGVASRLSEIATEDDPMAIAVAGTPYWMAPEAHHLLFLSDVKIRLQAQNKVRKRYSCVIYYEYKGWGQWAYDGRCCVGCRSLSWPLWALQQTYGLWDVWRLSC